MAFGRRQSQVIAQESSESGPVTKPEEILAASQWAYQDTTDEMTGQKTQHATLLSDNPFVLPFPYNKATYVRLILMRSVRLSASFALTNGQYAPGVGELMFSSKIDDGRVINWTGKRTNVQGLILIETPVQFINELRPGRRLMLQVELHQAGHRVFRFNCSGLDAEFR